MIEKVTEKIEEHFCRVKDPRKEQSKEHKLLVLDILSINCDLRFLSKVDPIISHQPNSYHSTKSHLQRLRTRRG